MHSLSSMHGTFNYLLAKSDASRTRMGETLKVIQTGDPCRTFQAHFRSSRLDNGRGFWLKLFAPLPLIAITTVAGASHPHYGCHGALLFSGDSVARGDTLARTVMQLLIPPWPVVRVKYITFSFAVMPFFFVQPLATYVLIIGQDEAFVQVSKLRRSVLSHN